MAIAELWHKPRHWTKPWTCRLSPFSRSLKKTFWRAPRVESSMPRDTPIMSPRIRLPRVSLSKQEKTTNLKSLESGFTNSAEISYPLQSDTGKEAFSSLSMQAGGLERVSINCWANWVGQTAEEWGGRLQCP